MIGLIIYLLIVGCVVALVWYVVGAIPIPDPLGRVIRIVTMVIAMLIIILMLLQLVGGIGGDIHLPRIN